MTLRAKISPSECKVITSRSWRTFYFLYPREVIISIDQQCNYIALKWGGSGEGGRKEDPEGKRERGGERTS